MDHVMLSMHYIQKGLLFLKPSFSESGNAVTPKEFMDTLLQKLKDSLATTLIHFYPLAGRLSTLKTDNPRYHSVFVDCNNSPGAGFIHAKSDLSVSDILGSKYVPLVVQSLFDHHKSLNRDGHTMSLLSVKVTELVDGVFIGLSMNHTIGDGSSFWQFFNSLSEIFNSQEETIGNNNNKLLYLKNPPIFREVSGPIYSLPFSEPDESLGQSEPPILKERMFHFSSETVRSLKSKANQEYGTTKISSLQSLTAFIWRSITRARKLPNDQETTCRLAAGNRSRMDPPLPENYFGVYLSPVQTTTKAGNLLENEFGWAALKLHQAVTEHNGEKISSEMNRWLKSFLKLGGLSSPNIVHMGSSPRFNKYGCEFGMGKAVAVRSGYGGKFDGKISAYPGREGGGSIDLEVCLLPEFMEALESDQEFMSLASSSS
ncbi:Transferase [Arabidopsis thaliana x Arabidopsis arenosa]|uniref:Transferase n=1 Tax=Arabidopsis thaliana x Arabidopsis arenosa TaxID=1240361 RepID=A0A8T1YUX0_9BRAS|nr:Transferase [Arabidopsis thaliana x Arabidopsis arenosa]